MGDEIQIQRRCRRIPNTDDLFLYEEGGNDDAVKHFQNIRPTIEGLLIDDIKTARLDNPNPQPISIRYLLVGKREEEPAPHLVVFCPPDVEKIVQSFFESPLAKLLLDPPRRPVPRLQVLIVPCAPKEKLAHLGIDVRCDSITTSDQTTFCGAPISLSKTTRGACAGRKRKATFGGVIKITFGQGESKLYGITAGHILNGLKNDVGDVDQTANSVSNEMRTRMQ